MARFTTQDRKTLTRLYQEGHTYKEIASRMQTTPGTVSRHARAMGLRDQRLQADPTGPSVLSMRQQRTEIAARLLHDAVKMLDAVDQPYIAYAAGGKDFAFVKEQVDPMPRDKADLVRSAVLLLAEHRNLTDFDAEDGAAAARSVLGALAQAIGVAAVELEGGRVVGEILAGTAEDA